MIDHVWRGGAPAVAQVDTITIPAEVEAGQVFKVSIGNKTIPYTFPDGPVREDVVAAIVDLWNGSEIPEFTEIVATDNGDGRFTLTANEAGKPFVVSFVIGGGGANEKQVITMGGSPSGGTFTLDFDGQETDPIAYNASAATIKTELEALSNIEVDDITVTGDAGGPWEIEFIGNLAGTDVELIKADSTSLVGGTNEVQTISMINAPTGGTFRLSFNGEWTGDIAYNASAGTIQTALLALNAIPAGGVTCGGGAFPGTPVTVTFTGFLANTDVAIMIADSSSLTGISGSVTVDTEGGSVLAGKTQHFWSFEEETLTINEGNLIYTDEVGGGELDDIIGGGQHDLAIIFPTTAGLLGWAIFNAQKNYMRSSGSVGQFNEDEPFSLSIACKPTANVGSKLMDLVTKGESSDDPDRQYALYINASGNVVFDRKKSSGYHTVTSAGTVTEDEWNLIVAVWDPENTRIRISVNNATFTDTTGLTVGTEADNGTERFRLWTPSIENKYEGYVDSLGVYNDALSQDEAGYVHNSGTGDDYPFPTAAGTNEVQSLALTGTPSTGEATVSFGGYSVGIPVDATASEAEALLQSLETIGSGNVDVTGGPWPGSDLVVEFINDLGVLDVAKLEVDIESLLTFVEETTSATIAPLISVATTDAPVIQAHTTANEGPHDWNTPSNWDTGIVPGDDDNALILDGDHIYYGLDQSGVTLNRLEIHNYETQIGLPRRNSDGGFEYLPRFLAIGASEIIIGLGDGNGSNRINLDIGTGSPAIEIRDSGTGESGELAIQIIGVNETNTASLLLLEGEVGIATYPKQAAHFEKITQRGGELSIGSNVTILGLTKTEGEFKADRTTVDGVASL